MSAAFFRANVGACVVNAEGRILTLKRKGNIENAWQMPQGGIEAGEDPRTAVLRELKEETGLLPQDVTIIAEHPEWLPYELPVQFRNAKTGLGQVQKWFLIQASETTTVIPDGVEFEDSAWLKPEDLLKLVVWFRRPVYERVLAFVLQNQQAAGTRHTV